MAPLNLPIGLSNGQEPRKISRMNLENAFAFILLWISALGVAYGPELIGIVGIIYNKIQISFMRDASRCIDLLKRTRAWYVAHIRGCQPGEKGFKMTTEWIYEEECPLFLQGVLPRIASICEGKKFGEVAHLHQAIFALLSLDRVIVLPAKPNYSTITAKSTAPEDLGLEGKGLLSPSEIKEALLSIGITPEAFKEKYRQSVSQFHYEVLTSSGPNGQATWTAHSDVRAWAVWPKLFKQFRVLLEESGMSFMLNDMVGVAKLPNGDIAPDRGPRIGKLNVIEEWGGKARIVASLDYWTQMALTPLHNTVNSFLKGLPEDGTFDQEKAVAAVKSWTTNSETVLNCFDLTAATDRLPISLQKEILSILFGSVSLATAWSKVLSDRSFMTPEGNKIFYQVGQPMGARSSFPMLALTHHVIIHAAARRADLPSGWDYRIVGDDSSIVSGHVAAKYREIMLAYGLIINETKSILHSDGALVAGELCKHTFIEGVELSSIPVKTVCKTVLDGREVAQLQNELVKRNPSISPKQFWILVSSFLDKESIKLHLKNNLVPSSVSGLSRSLVPNGYPLANPSKWFKGVSLTEKDIIEVYTWTSAVEALKRLDALLRTSLGIGALIQQYAKEHDSQISPWISLEGETEVKEVATEMAGSAVSPTVKVPPLNSSHPVVRASEYEASRISDLLYLLASADENMVESARLGLLDRFRNILTDLLSGKERMSVIENRSLLLKVFKNLDQLCRHSAGNTLEYSVVLTMVGRTWSVRFVKGGVVTINAVQARVSPNMVNAENTFAEACGAISFEVKPIKQKKGKEVVKKV